MQRKMKNGRRSMLTNIKFIANLKKLNNLFLKRKKRRILLKNEKRKAQKSAIGKSFAKGK